MRFASFVGQPIISFIFKRGSLSRFLLARKTIVAINAATDSISMKLMVNVYKPPRLLLKNRCSSSTPSVNISNSSI